MSYLLIMSLNVTFHWLVISIFTRIQENSIRQLARTNTAAVLLNFTQPKSWMLRKQIEFRTLKGSLQIFLGGRIQIDGMCQARFWWVTASSSEAKIVVMGRPNLYLMSVSLLENCRNWKQTITSVISGLGKWNRGTIWTTRLNNDSSFHVINISHSSFIRVS